MSKHFMKRNRKLLRKLSTLQFSKSNLKKAIKQVYSKMLESDTIDYNPVQSLFVEELNTLQAQLETYNQFWEIIQKKQSAPIEQKQPSPSVLSKQNPQFTNFGIRSFFEAFSIKSNVNSQVKSCVIAKEEAHLKLESDVQTHTPKGLYAWGGPGCGKTFLMDLLYDLVDTRYKKRMHFNEFMLRVHQKNFAHSKVIFRFKS